jgi:hypothetical protein
VCGELVEYDRAEGAFSGKIDGLTVATSRDKAGASLRCHGYLPWYVWVRAGEELALFLGPPFLYRKNISKAISAPKKYAQGNISTEKANTRSAANWSNPVDDRSASTTNHRRHL